MSARHAESYPALAGSVSQARHAITSWLHAIHADRLLSGDVVLALSEACTNAVVHGYPDIAPGEFRVTADDADGAVSVTVSDDGCGMVPRPDSPGIGLGLPLMASLADQLEVAAATGGTGTVVSMRFDAPHFPR